MKNAQDRLALLLILLVGAVVAPGAHATAQAVTALLEPPARIIVSQPVAALLAKGVVVVPYRAENMRLVAVFGPNALDVMPRVGHLHVAVDGAPWHWVDASGEPLVLTGLVPGPHRVALTLANANHQPVDEASVAFVVPASVGPHTGEH